MSLYASLGMGADEPPSKQAKEDSSATAVKVPDEKSTAVKPQEKKTKAWSSSISMMAPNIRRKQLELAAKKAELQKKLASQKVMNKVGKAPAQITIGSASGGKNGPAGGLASMVTTTVVPGSVTTKPIREPFLEAPEVFIECEYDPFRPNEFEEVVQAQKRIAAEQRQAKRRRDEEEERHMMDFSDDEGGYRSPSPLHRGVGAAIAPPADLMRGVTSSNSSSIPSAAKKAVVTAADLKISGDEAFNRRAMLSQTLNLSGEEAFNRRAQLSGQQQPPQQRPPQKKKAFWQHENIAGNSTASPVVVLKNMVDLAGVDADLQGEIWEECSKYGSVKDCLIHKRPFRKSPEEQVRIFVEFNDPDSAEKVVTAMNGRFFAGRTIQAQLYPYSTYKAAQYER